MTRQAKKRRRYKPQPAARVTSFRLPPDMRDDLDRISRKRLLSRSQVMAEVIGNYISGWKRKQALGRKGEE